MDLTRRVVGLAGAQAWIGGVASRLVLGEHVVLVFPPTMDSTPVVERIVLAAEERAYRVVEVDLASLDPTHPPLLSLPA